MRRPVSLLPALAAVAAITIAGLAAAPAPATTTAQAEDEPLRVEIDSLTPSSVPERGPIRMRGTVTNVSDERWQAINVYFFIGDTPITSEAELAEAVRAPVQADVGGRITTPGTFANIGSLAPGASASFTIRLNRNQLLDRNGQAVSEPGVYWFGAHALGNTDEARDTVADGRARTFLPLVPPGNRRTVQASLVLPLRRAVRHLPGGRIAGVDGWADDLAPGGRLDRLVDFGLVPGAGRLTWLVDPAVPDAVARLVAGNPPRTLSDTTPPGREDEEPDATESPSETPDGDGGPAAGDDERLEDIAGPGSDWLEGLRAALTGREVLTLPYGDLDVAAAARSDGSDPTFYDRAVRRTGTELDRWEIPTSPAVSDPDGYLAPRVLEMLRGDETVIASDRALELDAPVTAADLDNRRVLLASAATGAGGPGPEHRLGEVALRQRVLADAALRLLFHDRAPLLVVLPRDFQPTEPRQFWAGLQADWLELADAEDLDLDPAGTPDLTADDLVYPVAQELSELDAGNFEAAEALVAAGRTLENVLTNNDQVGGLVLDEALTSLSFSDRGRALESRADTVQSTQWITRKLQSVRIRAPRGVTLASAAGSFAATVTNRLNHPVTVAIVPQTLGGAVTVEEPAPLQLAAKGRQTVVLEASASEPGVHYVRLQVTDEDGTPLGAGQRVPIRSAAVSDVIWLILGVGVGLLFLAIAVRVVRRIRSERV